VSAAGCASRKGDGLHVESWEPSWKGGKHEATFRYGSPGDEWEPIADRDIQVAWHHRSDPAVIQIFSECGSHGDSDLEDFTDHQRIDYSSWKISQEPTGELDADGRPRMQSKQYYSTIAAREALRTTVEANLDGAAVTIEYVVLKKNGCLFDITYITVPRAFESHLGEFEAVIEGFRFPVRGQ